MGAAFHEILDCKLNYPAKGRVEEYRNDILHGDYPEAKLMFYVRELELTAILGMVIVHHLGYQITDGMEIRKLMALGARLAEEYFFGD